MAQVGRRPPVRCHRVKPADGRGGHRYAGPTMTATRHDETLVAQAADGDEDAFARLIEPYRGELHAHCYRMLGSVHDAEDALQDAMLRAWRALARFEGRSSLRSWLYTICTNACLDLIAKRPKRTLPIDRGSPSDPALGTGTPLAETVWIEPYPDEVLALQDGFASPDAIYDRRESIELAFIAALQHLAATQRAVLIFREVLGFSAKEVAEALGTTVASVNSALQRARGAVADRVPEQSQQQTLRVLGDDEVRRLVDRYVEAWERNDVGAFAALLAEDATFTMPPMATWFAGRDAIAVWAAKEPMNGAWRWRVRTAHANGQRALGYYAEDGEGGWFPFALNVLEFRGREIGHVTAFIARSPEQLEADAQQRLPDEPAEEPLTRSLFVSFGLPARLDD
jgi:RNA polymerase sigma-70 factor, ECF subfamily